MKSSIFFIIAIIFFVLGGNAQNVGIGTIAPAVKLEITHNGASTYGTALLINQNVIGNSDGPKIQFQKTMTLSKTWTAGISNGVDVGAFIINEDGGLNGFGINRFTIAPGGNVGIGNSSPNAPLSFPALLGKKITLYPGVSGDVGFAVAGNRLQIYADNPNADVALGYDAAGTFIERFAFKPTGAIALNGIIGQAGQVLQSNGSGTAASWASSTNSLYNNINMINVTGYITLSAASSDQLIPGMTYTFSNSTNAKVILNTNIEVTSISCGNCGFSDSHISFYLDNTLRAIFYEYIVNDLTVNVNPSYLFTVAPGTHTIEVRAAVSFGPNVRFANPNWSNMIVQVIPQ